MKPFGSMPADKELAGFGCGFGGLILGMVTPDLVFLAMDRTVPLGVSPQPWWITGLLAAAAFAIAIQVTGWTLRVALIAFAIGRLVSIVPVQKALPIGPVLVAVLNGLFACALIVAAWPRAGRLAKVVTVVLFAGSAAARLWITGFHSSVFG